MKIVLLILSLLFIFALKGQETFYLKEVVRMDTYKDSKQVESKVIGENEVWISDHQIALNESKRSIILDIFKKEFCIIIHNKKTYVKTTLPLDNSLIMDEELINYLPVTTGKVSKKSGTKTILSRTCATYQVEIWEKDNKKKKKRILKVWAAPEVPFNYNLYTGLLHNMRILYNRDEKLRNELLKIEGIQLFMESVIESSDVEKRIVTEVVSLEQKDLPEGIFDIPDGYTRKEMLSKMDFEQ